MRKPQVDLSFTTPASIVAFCEAEHDRMAYRRGRAPEMHIAEPSADETTQRWTRPSRSELLGC
jgi:hypothetical protein